MSNQVAAVTKEIFKTFDELELAVAVHGNETSDLTVFLAHCWTFDKRDWHHQVKYLTQKFGKQIRIITWDHRGHGQSTKAPYHTCTIANLSHDLNDLINHYAPSGKLILAGHSIGGMTLMGLAEFHPETLQRVVGVAFISTAAAKLNQLKLGFEPLGNFIKKNGKLVFGARNSIRAFPFNQVPKVIEIALLRNLIFGDKPNKAEMALAMEAMSHISTESMTGFFDDFLNNHDRLQVLAQFDKIPSVIMVGEKDQLTPPNLAIDIHQNIANSELIRLPHKGHMLPQEAPSKVNQVLAELISSALTD